MKKKFSKLLGIGLTVALVTSLLTIVGPAMALSQPQVSLPFGQNVIGGVTTYTLTFETGKAVAAPNQIVIAFPAGVNISGLVLANVTLEALTGLGGNAFGPAAAPKAVTVAGFFPNAQTMTITLDDTVVPAQDLGNGALVGVTITGVTNPTSPGDYTLTVATQTPGLIPIETAVTSTTFTITSPQLLPLPGIVTAYNSAGYAMAQSTSIQAGINAAGPGGKVEVGPGTYDEEINCSVARQTIVGIGDPGTVIIKDTNGDGLDSNTGAAILGGGGTITVTAAGSAILKTGVTLENLTIEANAYAFVPAPIMLTLAGTSSYVTVKDCTITSGTAAPAFAVGVASPSTNNKIQGCTITAQHATAARVGIATDGQVAVSDTTIDVGAAAVTQAVIVTDTGAVTFALLPTSITNCTITGSGGRGIMIGSGTVTVKDSTLSTLTNALDINGGAVTVDGNTIDGCGSFTPVAADAITIDGVGTTVNLYNNTISNSNAFMYAINIGAGAFPAAGAVVAHFNNITDNAKNITTAVAMNASHNWWGSADGPAFGSIIGAGVTTTAPVLGASTSDAEAAFARTSLITKNTLGVDVMCMNNVGAATAVTAIGISKYADNPVVTIPTIIGTGSVLAYYDIYVLDAANLINGVGAGVPAGTVQIKFYGAISPYTKLYYAGGIGQQWGEPTTVTGAPAWGVNVAGGYVYLTITGGTNPSILGLSGTPFVLLEDKTVAPPALSEPVVGEYDISIEPMFTWGTVPGAIRYEITLSEDPTFNIIEWSYNVDQTFYKADEALRYDTTYYWRVRGVLAEPYSAGPTWITPATPWATGIFTTETEAVEAPETIVVEPPKPEVNVEIPPTRITVEPSSPVIPNYMLWIIIAVGAVLVIALIVLIVRTRRVV